MNIYLSWVFHKEIAVEKEGSFVGLSNEKLMYFHVRYKQNRALEIKLTK